MINLLINEVKDPVLRENFKRIKAFLDLEAKFNGFAFFEAVLPDAVTNYKIFHGLGYVPRDVITISITGNGIVTFNHDEFDENYLDITTATGLTGVGADVEIRGFTGRYDRDL